MTNITCTDEVQVLTPSRATWEARLAGLDAPTGARRIATPGGFVQNELRLWWPDVERDLQALGLPAGGAATEPRFVAIDMAQHLLTRFTAPLADADGGLVRGARTAARMQRLQVLDALARGIENRAGLVPCEEPCAADLGLDQAKMAGAIADELDAARVAPVADAVLGLAATIAARLEAAQAPGQVEARFAPQLGGAIALYADQMLRWRVLDHALQLLVYADVLWRNPRYQLHLQARTSWLLVEDLDELPARWLALVEGAMGSGIRVRASLKSDPGATGRWRFQGGLKQHLGADTAKAWELAAGRVDASFADDEAPPLADLGRALVDGLLDQPRLAAVERTRVDMKLDAYTASAMLDAVAHDVRTMLRDSEPFEVAIVVPAISQLMIWQLRDRLAKSGTPLYVFAGTNKITDHRSVRLMLTIAQLYHPAWRCHPSRFEMLELLEAVTAQNPLKLARLSETLFPGGALCEPELLPMELDEASQVRYLHLWNFLQHRVEDEDLQAFLRRAFVEVWVPFQRSAKAHSAEEEAAAREYSQIGQLIELAGRFRDVDKRLAGDDDQRGPNFLKFLQEQPIAERPFFMREPHRQAVMLATASQLAERGFADPAERLKHLVMVDLASERWWKTDRKELVNGRVLAASRPPGPYQAEEEQRDKTEKLARVLMACCSKVEEKLWLYASVIDEENQENKGSLPDLLAVTLGMLTPGGAA